MLILATLRPFEHGLKKNTPNREVKIRIVACITFLIAKHFSKVVIAFLGACIIFGMVAYQLASHYDRQGHDQALFSNLDLPI